MSDSKPSPLQSWDRQNKILLILGGVFLLAVLALGIFVVKNMGSQNRDPVPPLPPGTEEPITTPDPGEGIACTMDAKICPDGSTVGRTGPNCEFAPCPGEEGIDPEEQEPVQEMPIEVDTSLEVNY